MRPRAALLIAALTMAGAPAHGQVFLQSRVLQPSARTTADFLSALKAAPGSALHGLAAFARLPAEQEQKALAARGIHVLTPFQGYTFRVRVEKRADLRALGREPALTRLAALAAEDRVAPALWREEFDRYVVRRPGERPDNYVLMPDGSLKLSVLMHQGVSDAASRALLQKHALSFARRGKTAWLATVARGSLRALAGEDSVQWIGPGPLPFAPENNGVRAAINAEALQSFNPAAATEDARVQGLGGRNVRIGLFDFGMDDTHADLAGRVIKDFARVAKHATHEAGTIAGSGVLSTGVDSAGASNGGAAFQWRGVAPLASLIDADQENGGDSAKYLAYITTNGMDLSNHSYMISLDGEYSIEDALRDQLIRGDALSGATPVPPRLQVTSAGNNGQTPDPVFDGRQAGYFSLSKQAKNMLVVGNWDTTTSRIDNDLSSLGPAHDGRIKPDVVAPGRTVASGGLYYPAGGVKSAGFCSPESTLPDCDAASPTRRNFYRPARGTSMASAATSGAIALVLEQYAATYSVDLDAQPPLPSTLRGVMIHTARDKESTSAWTPNPDGEVKPASGPDFVTGWGLIDAQAAAGVVAGRLIVEDSVPATCHVMTYVFRVLGGPAPRFRITLAWDDFEGDSGTSYTAPKLVNDLDLELIDPAGNRHYPWRLDQKILDASGNELADASQECGMPVTVKRSFVPIANPAAGNDTVPPGGAPKADSGKDHLNNVEVIDAPTLPGTWTARVTAFNVPKGPQRFSLIGAQFTLGVFQPTALCRLYPALCAKLRFHMDICERHPKICGKRISFPAKDTIRIQFAQAGQKVVLPVDLLCRVAVSCPVCAEGSRCRSYDIEMRSAGASLRAAAYSGGGRVAARDNSAGPGKRLKFTARAGEQYFVVLEPGRDARPEASHDLRLVLN
jgi:subtilisin family serine protease